MCIKFKNVSLYIGKKRILSNVNMEFKKGFSLVCGKSGSGKTSLLKLINMLYSPTNGKIMYKNRDLGLFIPNQWRGRCILTKQMPSPTDGTVLDNLKLPFSFKAHKNKQFNSNLLLELIERFGLEQGILNEDSKTISGGEAQRVALIRTILLTPDLFLFDEPTSALDNKTETAVFEYIKNLSKQHICIVCSHTQKAVDWSDTSVTIKNGSVLYD